MRSEPTLCSGQQLITTHDWYRFGDHYPPSPKEKIALSLIGENMPCNLV
ncbi:hypothetical protein [Yersinia similis]|nr:hypothetical protein [Yersinia similis]